ncbi:Transcription factor DIVARICATA [Hibiscus syriacus]|uniref:Transcription factor DIVARICATA n=1 Tax=Hibiscus syriacus TaxID=106335 RepID=A0A6A2XJ36_HIBSY|nr:Transcription factor DIVARICATA [Hibiscus syriacus]
MEASFATSFMSNLGLFDQDITYWTKEENKRFESALAIYGEDVPDRWIKVAAMIPGKTVADVIKQYRELEEDVFDIESGRVPIPGYLTSEMVDHHDSDAYRRRSSVAKGADHERKKGVPWTEEEHRRFLMGLMKYGKGDWRNISRNFVISKTPTQVASHAQKYYQRQISGGKDKKRPSIHDITTLNITTTTGFSHNQSAHVLALKQKLPSIRKLDRNDYVSVTSAEQYQTSNGLGFEGQNLYKNGSMSVDNVAESLGTVPSLNLVA